jgi:hypothetical protein
MAWLLAGRSLAQGRQAVQPEPAPATLAAARDRAGEVARRAGVRRIDAEELARFEAEAGQRSLYRFDVRTQAEYEAGHLEGWRWAPGGQLVQATRESCFLSNYPRSSACARTISTTTGFAACKPP